MQMGWCALPFLVRECRILVDNCKARFCACPSPRVRIFRYPLVGHNEVFRLCSGNGVRALLGRWWGFGSAACGSCRVFLFCGKELVPEGTSCAVTAPACSPPTLNCDMMCCVTCYLFLLQVLFSVQPLIAFGGYSFVALGVPVGKVL
ncbi:hypothetical protein TRVL_08151 [Trypanosoma vivax]|nr:hypothetical protein TRVL_08151 [Trypanosoma vivax]